MVNASNAQMSFLGGEWSQSAQGRFDDPEYKRGMNVCYNGFPIETGAWTRRQGTRFCATTRYGQYAWILPFAFAATSPYNMEFTNGILRFFAATQLAATNDPQAVTAISTANPAVVQTAGAHGWSSGNMIYFIFTNSQAYPGAALLFLRQFVITVVDTTHFSIADPITGNGIDGSQISIPANVAQVLRVEELTSPYTTPQLPSINRIQAEGTVITLCPGVAPYALVETTAPTAGVFGEFTFNPATFVDGPYLDPPTTGTLMVSATSGTITVSGAPANTFASTDVGRHIRMMSQPNQWASGTAYTTGQLVTYNNAYYVALVNNTGNIPGADAVNWGTATNAAGWAWGTIASFISGTSVTVTLQTPLLTTNTIQAGFWRLGVYSATTSYPTNGLYHEGRLWLAGAVDNRVDASMAGGVVGGTITMSPTGIDGTVSDANGISYVFNAADVNPIFWMLQQDSGIVCGTKGGEWVISASNTQDPLTPTNIQAHRRSIYRGANTPPVHAGLSLIFVQAFARKLIEYVADVFSGKFLGRNLNEKSKHLTAGNVAQIAYQQELVPIVWGRTATGNLIGTTYRRESAMTAQPPEYNGWHRHALGSGRLVEVITIGPNPSGTAETLALSTNMTNIMDPYYGVRHIEMLTDLYEETDDIYAAWFLDDAVTPSAAVENSTNTQVTFYGVPHLIGKTVSVFAGGLDLGDYVVASNGSVTVPINGVGSQQFSSALFTDALLAQLINSGENYGQLAVPLNQSVAVQYPQAAGQTIQSYISPIITTCQGIVDDYAHNQMISYWNGNGSSGGIAIFNRFTGVQKIAATAATIMSSTNYQTTINTVPSSPLILGSDGFLYCTSGASNSTVLRKIAQSTLKIVGNFGVPSGSFLLDNIHLPQIKQGVSLNVSGKNYLVYTGSSSTLLSIIDIDTMTFAGHILNFMENTAGQLCLGEVISGPLGYGAVYSISVPAADSTTPAGLYRTVIGSTAPAYFMPNTPPALPSNSPFLINQEITSSRIAQISPANVDATWTHFRQFIGPAYDPTDGNLVCVCNTGDSVTNTCYVIKVNSRTGAIIWATPITGTSPTSDIGMAMSEIKFSQMVIINGASATFNIINTSTGNLVSANTNPSLTSYSYNTSNDIDSSVCSFGSWTGATMTGVNGTVAFGSQAFKIQPIAGFNGQTTYYQSGSIPAVIGFTYASQGQLLRPVSPEMSGARDGPAFGKSRRNHRYAMALVNTIAGSSANIGGLKVGTDFGTSLRAALLASAGGVAYNQGKLFTGQWTQPLEDTYTYDGMISWQITRPNPATVSAVGGFLETMDR